MSGERDPEEPGGESDAEATEAEDSAGIVASDEMEAALREATQSVEQRQSDADADSDSGEKSPDKLTIELLSQELQSLKEEFEARCKELEESNERHLRLQAEFENFRRRGLKERQESLQFGHQNLVKDLLSTVDNLDRSM